MSALLRIECLDCGHETQTTMAWLSDRGLICEGCYRNVPLNTAELDWGLAMIDRFWGEVDDTVAMLKQPLAAASRRAALHLAP
jgi:hypothetical protein